MTHADSDHMEGADEVLEEVRIDEIHLPYGSDNEETMEDVLLLAEEKKIPVLQLGEGAGWSVKDIEFYYLAPTNKVYRGNDSSLVLYMKTGGPSFLFTGDLESEGEKELLKRYGHMEWGDVILKAGHHGSRTSSTEPFIRTLDPLFAVLSYGRNNRYGHPHEEVLNTFSKNGVQTMSTAQHGSITVHVKKDEYAITTSANEKTDLSIPLKE